MALSRGERQFARATGERQFARATGERQFARTTGKRRFAPQATGGLRRRFAPRNDYVGQLQIFVSFAVISKKKPLKGSG